MKKFLIFLSAIIVVICLGMTFYYFAKDEELIKINTSTIYLNVGDSISLDELGFSHTEAKKETKINFNAGGDDVQSIIYYDSNSNSYKTTSLGGKTTIVIKTNNKKFKRFEINVVVGNGSQETPFHIFDEEDLFNIGTMVFDTTPADSNNDAMNANYVLMNNIIVSGNHDAIGKTETGYDVFNGNFNGNYHTIQNLTINEGTYGGLFANLGENSIVQNLYISNATVVGSFEYAGVLSGIMSGYADRISIIDSVVNNTNTNTNSFTGGVTGKLLTVNSSNFESVPATLYRTNVSSSNQSINYIRGNGYLGGIAGEINCANLEGIKLDTLIKSSGNSNYVGGFAGKLTLENDFGFVRESLSLSTINASNNSNAGALFGYANIDGATVDGKSILLGLYYSSANNLDCYAKTNWTGINQSLTTVSAKTETELKEIATYLFYINTNDEKVLWSNNVWSLIEGQYPKLKFTTLSISNGSIDMGEAGKDNNETNQPNDGTDTNTPSNGTNDPSTGTNDPITNPDLPEDVKDKVVLINNSQDLLSITYQPDYSYYICNDINLNGATISPQALNNALFTSYDNKVYTIKNFSIAPNTSYAGFFSSVNNSTIKNICLEDVNINAIAGVDYVGVLAGKVNNATISNVQIKSCSIVSNLSNIATYDELPIYAAGLVGATTTANNKIENIDISNITISGNIINAGGLVGLINNNTQVLNSSVSGSISAKEYVGGITAKNQGQIDDACFEGEITTVNQTEASSYIGGIAGANFNTISNCLDNVLKIQAVNSSSSKRYSVGGITGYNTNVAKITNCSVYGEGVITDNNVGTMLLGGIAGQNDGQITSAYNKMDCLGTSYKNTFAGGIVSKNAGNSASSLMGKISKSYSVSDIHAEYVGGIVYANIDNATVVESAVMADCKLKGTTVAGIVCYLDSGLIKNCLADAEVCGFSPASTEAVSCGLVLEIRYYNNTTFGHIDHCISSVKTSASSNGEFYLITNSSINSKTVSTGKITNCVIDKTETNNALLPTGKASNRAEEWRSDYKVITASTQMAEIATYTNFEISQEADQVWYLQSGTKLPTLTALINK